MTKLLIDGDEYLFKACALAEIEIMWDDQNHVLQANENEAWDNFTKAIERVAEKFDAGPVGDVVLCFSDTKTKPNFRLAIDPNYKSNRAGKRKPLCYATLRERANTFYNTQSFPGLEADDVIGILATKPGANCIIVSQDKDMKTLPAKIWTGDELLSLGEDHADFWHMFQTLTGDASDGYKGCPGIGAVKAEKLLGEASVITAWKTVVEAYEKKGLTEEDALRNARLARILRWDDWDRKKKEPILWTPHRM